MEVQPFTTTTGRNDRRRIEWEIVVVPGPTREPRPAHADVAQNPLGLVREPVVGAPQVLGQQSELVASGQRHAHAGGAVVDAVDDTAAHPVDVDDDPVAGAARRAGRRNASVQDVPENLSRSLHDERRGYGLTCAPTCAMYPDVAFRNGWLFERIFTPEGCETNPGLPPLVALDAHVRPRT
ncbi:hypothetical protein PG985_002232 [Apiospora marii]|uniref:uncharacterized protein n=1 Tax=Apiospora marii TaxID=335849 RepID=UPI003131A9CC